MKRLVVIAVTLSSLVGAACGTVAKDSDKVMAAIDRTEQVARTFTYTENAAGHRLVVDGTVRDDMRYRLDVAQDGTPVASEIVDDDTRALMFNGPAGRSILVPASGASTSAPTALPTGVWLEDPAGAASLTLNPPPQKVGNDPFVDSLTALEYVRRAVHDAGTVQLYNPQADTYRPRLDVFPKPSSGEQRYDLIPPDLPARQRIGGSTSSTGLLNQVPGAPFFRLMAVYVRNGMIVDVRELISILPRLTDPQSNLEARLGDFTNAVSANAPVTTQATALLFALNRKLQLTGQALIRPRALDLRFTSLGSAPAVTLPSGQQADLSSFGTYGLLLYESK